MILSYEKMDIYAYIGILEVILQLALTFMVSYINATDSLILYAVFISINSIIINGCYVTYARKCTKACHKINYWNAALAKEVGTFSVWNLFGAISSVIRSQGINLLLGVFFSPVINAARGIAYQVSNALNQLSHNFYAATRPQIIKRYSNGDREETLKLVLSSSKFTFFLFLFVGAPVFIYIEPILNFWLDDVPEYTAVFARLVILTAMIDSFSHPLMTLAQATGKVALYQSVVGSITILNLPVSWLFLCHGCSAVMVFKVILTMSFFALVARLLILNKMIDFPISLFLKRVISPIIITGFIVFLELYVLEVYVYEKMFGLLVLFLLCFLSVLISILTIFFVGLTQIERKALIDYIRHYKNRKK